MLLDERPEKKSIVALLGEVATVITALATLHGFFLMSQFLLKMLGSSAPANLTAMVLLVACLAICQKMQGDDDKTPLHVFLNQGVAFLKTWMPLWFLPHLAVLPLAPLKQPLTLGILLVTGMLFTLLGTAYTVLAVERFLSQSNKRGDEEDDERRKLLSPPHSPPSLQPHQRQSPYPASLQMIGGLLALSAGIGALLLRPRGTKAIATATAGRVGDFLEEDMLADIVASAITDPLGAIPPAFRWLELVFLLATTFTAYVSCMRMPAKVRQIVHPLLGATIILWLVALAYVWAQGGGLGGWSGLMGSFFNKKARSKAEWGAGNYLAFFLNLVVLSFGISMFEKRGVILKSWPMVVTGSLFACASGLLGTAILARVLGIHPDCRPNVLPRCATIPLALEMNCQLGGDASAVASICIMTALLGALLGKPVLGALRIDSPAARGVSMGCAAHGLGVAAMLPEPEAFALAAASMAVAGSMGVIALAFPMGRSIVLSLAGCS